MRGKNFSLAVLLFGVIACHSAGANTNGSGNSPLIYEDPSSHYIFYVESNGNQIAAITSEGKVAWSRNPDVLGLLTGNGAPSTPKPITSVAACSEEETMLEGKLPVWITTTKDIDQKRDETAKPCIEVRYGSSVTAILDMKTGRLVAPQPPRGSLHAVNPNIAPVIYKDAISGLIFLTETNQQEVSAIHPEGRILWSRNVAALMPGTGDNAPPKISYVTACAPWNKAANGGKPCLDVWFLALKNTSRLQSVSLDAENANTISSHAPEPAPAVHLPAKIYKDSISGLTCTIGDDGNSVIATDASGKTVWKTSIPGSTGIGSISACDEQARGQINYGKPCFNIGFGLKSGEHYVISGFGIIDTETGVFTFMYAE